MTPTSEIVEKKKCSIQRPSRQSPRSNSLLSEPIKENLLLKSSYNFQNPASALQPNLCHFINNSQASMIQMQIKWQEGLVARGEEILRELVYLLGDGDNGLAGMLVCSLLCHGERYSEQPGHNCELHPAAHLCV